MDSGGTIGWMEDGCMMDREMDGWMDGWTDRQMRGEWRVHVWMRVTSAPTDQDRTGHPYKKNTTPQLKKSVTNT